MKKHLLPLALLFSGISPAQALDVGDISSFMNSDSSTLSKTIQNSTDSGRLINIRLERLSSPLDDGQVIATHSRQLAATRPSQRSDPLLL